MFFCDFFGMGLETKSFEATPKNDKMKNKKFRVQNVNLFFGKVSVV